MLLMVSTLWTAIGPSWDGKSFADRTWVVIKNEHILIGVQKTKYRPDRQYKSNGLSITCPTKPLAFKVVPSNVQSARVGTLGGLMLNDRYSARLFFRMPVPPVLS